MQAIGQVLYILLFLFIATATRLDTLGLERRIDVGDDLIALGEDILTEDRHQLLVRRIERAAKAEAHAAALRIDPDDAEDELVALLDDLLRMRNPLVGQLRDVDQTFDAILDPGEGAEVGLQ